MCAESEQQLEDKLIKQLGKLGYSFVKIDDEAALLTNLKTQIEKHNELTLSDKDFRQVLNHLSKGTTFDKAKTLRDRFSFTNEAGELTYIRFINQQEWCKNEFQVTNQVTIKEGKYENRYDVTLLVNGLPLIQIELKRRGIELKEAFHQIQRYQHHSFWASHGLFHYVQLFVISNGANTKYYSNNHKLKFEFTFYWFNEAGKRLSQLEDFTNSFLEPCQAAKMITQYIVLHESNRALMVLRQYQYHAVEAILERVKNGRNNGYIWHTTGSGKTLTSFKASQLLVQMPKVDKVLFVVDRNDLDYQTSKEFNAFCKDSVDQTTDTSNLVKQLSSDKKLTVTTIQKLNNAITRDKFKSQLKHLKHARVLLIFDECHRSQFGDTHHKITEFFQKAQLFGFTGTPIFAENASKNDRGKRTTKDLFGECLHKYVITDAIRDENVLPFAIEYVGRYKDKTGRENYKDIEVEAIDTRELMESPARLEKITDFILLHHKRKTQNKRFTAMFCISSVETLTQYYELFKRKKAAGEHDLNIATIFSYAVNEAPKPMQDDNGELIDEMAGQENASAINPFQRDKLEACMADYNALFQTNFNTRDNKGFYNYYRDIAKRVREKQVDILLVVNMFLTGFDSPSLNTLYVDKNLKYHGLIQAYSRTNRIVGPEKSHGNIVCFRNLKKVTDEAVLLFGSKNAFDVIVTPPLEEVLVQFEEALTRVLAITPTPECVDTLQSEKDELEFVLAFRALLRLYKDLQQFSDFNVSDIGVSQQELNDFASKYGDLKDKVKREHGKEKVSVLDEVDFELELLHRDEINRDYILKLIAQLKEAPVKAQEAQKKAIIDMMGTDEKLRSKRELILQFIDINLPQLADADMVPEAYESFLNKERELAFARLSKEEKIQPEGLEKIIGDYQFSGRKPIRDEVINQLSYKPTIKERKTIGERVIAKILEFVDVFMAGE